MVMEAPSSSLSVLRHSLRATVCCFGGGGGGVLTERMRWSRRAGTRDFRYDPLSYALNFDEGDQHGVDGDEQDRAGGRVDALLLSSQPVITRRPGIAMPSKPRDRSVWPERRQSLVIDDD